MHSIRLPAKQIYGHALDQHKVPMNKKQTTTPGPSPYRPSVRRPPATGQRKWQKTARGSWHCHPALPEESIGLAFVLCLIEVFAMYARIQLYIRVVPDICILIILLR